MLNLVEVLKAYKLIDHIIGPLWLNMSEQPKTEWYKIFPRSFSKNDLEGIRFRIITDKPPKETTKSGLYELSMMMLDDNLIKNEKFNASSTIKTIVTNRDIDKIVVAAQNGHAFCFQKKSGDWAEVVELE